MKKALLILMLPLAGCVTLPKETVMLSGEMGGMIQSAKDAHINLLNEYERSRRERIDEYMQSTWIPRFIKSMAENGDLWGKTCHRKDTLDAAVELQGFVQAAAKKIEVKRKELTDELDDSMGYLRAALYRQYDILRLSNTTVTDNLRSIRRNDEVFEETLKLVKLPPVPEQLRAVSDKLDGLMN